MDAKLDAKRLEELKEWAIRESEDHAGSGNSNESKHMYDLARCAAAWAKVERECCNLGLMPFERQWQHINHSGRVKYGDTAIEAVEAAPEVKP